jgi:hypothetical protein
LGSRLAHGGTAACIHDPLHGVSSMSRHPRPRAAACRRGRLGRRNHTPAQRRAPAAQGV